MPPFRHEERAMTKRRPDELADKDLEQVTGGQTAFGAGATPLPGGDTSGGGGMTATPSVMKAQADAQGGLAGSLKA
jgi:hypothetical protein